ncbi:hypothetical protein NQ318_009404 [Aromia moschata]|uniref:Uncharacterized protein n=1 Tax=Aromia moschata TaxID=1265417 RepID=A0AAV8Z8Q0_9CUCU|nr:hypothetical protein NQ318_009404 [Aromia moschata]
MDRHSLADRGIALPALQNFLKYMSTTDLSGYVSSKKQTVLFYLFSDGVATNVHGLKKGVLGKVDIRQQLDSAYRENIRRHNENPD